MDKNVAGGLSHAAETVGLTGLVPFEVLTPAQVTLRPSPGTLRIVVELPAGRRLVPGKPVTYRVHGGEAGFDFERGGQIVNLQGVSFPLELRYEPRIFPTAPPRGELSVDLAFWHTDGVHTAGQDLQWRQPVMWDPKGNTTVELRYSLGV